MRKKSAVAILAFVGLCLTIGAVGGFATAGSVNTWFAGLAKPSFNPPSFVFGPVWTFLYILIGISGYLAWSAKAPRSSMAIYALQLALNLGWSLVFFGLRRPDLAFIEILALWVSIIANVLAFWKVHRTAALLLLPYLGWVSFAAVLNFAIWRLNP